VFMVPRKLLFFNGVCVGVNCSVRHDEAQILNLPSDHFDVIGPVNPLGKSLDHIRREIQEYTNGNA